MQAQDSSDPTGVAHLSDGKPGSAVLRARDRKANAALQMKLAGATWADIAEVLGYPTARQALVATERALKKELSTEQSQAAMRGLAGKRLERLLRGLWTKAIDPNHPEHLPAARACREVIAQHAKLYGLDAPTEMVVHAPTVTELEAWVSRVHNGATAPLTEPDIFADDDIVDADIVEEGEQGALPAGP
jgi:hypothetical protein